MKDVFYNFVLFFIPKRAIFLGLHFNFLTFTKPRKNIFFSKVSVFLNMGLKFIIGCTSPFHILVSCNNRYLQS